MDCSKAAYLIDKKETEKISFWDKIALRFHNFLCKRCTGYEKDSNILRKMMNTILKDEQCLTCSEKEEMKKELNK